MNQPELLIIGGPNGAGKTTFVNTYLPEFTRVSEFVNADLIARGLSPFSPESAMISSGRLLLERSHMLVSQFQNFAVETTLSGRHTLSLMRDAKSHGYSITLDYIFLNSVELSLQRVENRVREGGHDVPTEVIQRRYKRSLRNFVEVYASACDRWEFYNNSSSEYELWAEGDHAGCTVHSSEFQKIVKF